MAQLVQAMGAGLIAVFLMNLPAAQTMHTVLPASFWY
jgi:hypothetical protein